MPTKSHDTLAEFFGTTAYFMQLCQTPVFTQAERACIQPWVSNVALPASSKQSRSGSHKLGLREKLPGYALVYHPEDGNDPQPVFPHVVMEVGYSQAYDAGDSVLADIQEWLTATKEDVRLGVLFTIEEGRVPNKMVEQLEGLVGLGDGCDDDGKVTVFMETWVYGPTTGGIRRSQRRQYLMIDNIPVTPHAHPHSHPVHLSLPPLPDLPDENQEFNIDLTPYANNLLHNLLHDAFRRKTSWISRRRKNRKCAEGDDPMDGDFPGDR